MADKYESFTELSSAETEGDDFEVVLFDRGPLVVLAPHGGGIEPGTSEIATEVAGEDLSLYIFEGLKSRGNVDLHITSHRFDEPRCRSLMENAESALAVHGCVDRSASDSVVFVGGSDTRLRSALVEELSRAGFPAEVDTMLSGEHLSNVCNRARDGGAQLEITERARLEMFRSLRRAGRRDPQSPFWDFCTAARAGFVR